MSLIIDLKAYVLSKGIGANSFEAIISALTLLFTLATIIILLKNLKGLNKSNKITEEINLANNRSWFQVSLLPEYKNEPNDGHYFSFQFENRGKTEAQDIEIELKAGKPEILPTTVGITQPIRIDNLESLEYSDKQYQPVKIGTASIKIFPPMSKRIRVYKFEYCEDIIAELEYDEEASSPINYLTDFNLYASYGYTDKLIQKRIQITETFQLTLTSKDCKPPDILVTPLLSGDTYSENELKDCKRLFDKVLTVLAKIICFR